MLDGHDPRDDLCCLERDFREFIGARFIEVELGTEKLNQITLAQDSRPNEVKADRTAICALKECCFFELSRRDELLFEQKSPCLAH